MARWGRAGAWLLEPYTDKPDSMGLDIGDIPDLKRIGELAIQHDFQFCIHAIGDRANREVLNIYQQVFEAHPDKKDLRWRIEHAQHLERRGHSALRKDGRDRGDAGRFIARRTRRTCCCGWVRNGPRKARTCGRSS